MPVKPEVQQFLDLIASLPGPPPTELGPDENRAGFAALAATPGEEVASTTDQVIEGSGGPLGVRLYRPLGATPDETLPVLVWFHGGGFVIGDLETAHSQCCALANEARVAVVSVDYRLAPEHPFPAGSDDCLAVAAWLVEHAEAWFGTGDLLVGGESAGGYFAALTLLRIRDELGAIDRVRGANLVFGVYDLGGTPATHGFRPSDTPDILDLDTFAFVHECYLPDHTRDQARVPEISPLYADLQDLPPALFTVGSADHLLDDSLFMAARWAAYGNEAELAVYPDCVHGFTGFPMELAKRANERIDDFLVRAAG
jgi:acetyl esterase/lipase